MWKIKIHSQILFNILKIVLFFNDFNVSLMFVMLNVALRVIHIKNLKYSYRQIIKLGNLRRNIKWFHDFCYLMHLLGRFDRWNSLLIDFWIRNSWTLLDVLMIYYFVTWRFERYIKCNKNILQILKLQKKKLLESFPPNKQPA